MVLKQHRVVIWCGDAPNQRGLVTKIAKEFNLAGIVLDKRKGKAEKHKWYRLPGKILDRIRFRVIYDAWKNLMQYYRIQYSNWPDCPILSVSGINTPGVEEFTTVLKPDLIVVSGTSLVKEPLLTMPVRIGIINLHTGLSPYVKGGPNCTNWCIAKNDWHLVGNTIMWLNAGIDAGNIIASETIDIRDCKSLVDAHIRVMEHAHSLYLRTIRYLFQEPPPYNSVPQSELGRGNLYLTKMWNSKQRIKLLINWRKRSSVHLSDSPRTIALNREQLKS